MIGPVAPGGERAGRGQWQCSAPQRERQPSGRGSARSESVPIPRCSLRRASPPPPPPRGQASSWDAMASDEWSRDERGAVARGGARTLRGTLLPRELGRRRPEAPSTTRRDRRRRRALLSPLLDGGRPARIRRAGAPPPRAHFPAVRRPPNLAVFLAGGAGKQTGPV
jgi:hypothetical protein